MSAQTEEECVRESLDIARADGRREMARATVALAVSVIDERTRERDDAREKLRALVEAASALCRDAANRGELKDEMRDSWDACFNAIGAARGVL